VVDPAALLQEAADLLATREPHTAATLRADSVSKLTADGTRLRELFYAVLGTVASGAADRSTEISTALDAHAWTATITARKSEQLTDESLMAGMLADPEPPHRRRSTALWMLLADAIATRHGGSVELTYDERTGAGARITLPLTIPSG
jgi:hypothetical protein